MRKAGGNIYIAYAILIGWAKPEDVDTDEKLRAWKHSDKYALIKSVVLAHGFGMGHRKFRDQTEAKSHGKTKLTYDEAKKLTDQWRETNRPVCQFWRRMGNDFMRAVVLKQDEYSVKLPSGRVKRYFNPKTKVVFRKVKNEETGVETSEARVQMFAALTRGSGDFPLWGGILAQHVTQATARDIMTQAAVEVCHAHRLAVALVVLRRGHVRDSPTARSSSPAERSRAFSATAWSPAHGARTAAHRRGGALVLRQVGDTMFFALENLVSPVVHSMERPWEYGSRRRII